jgi:CheY-like chemotaxis protein
MGGLQVLLVEDDPDTRLVFAEVLRSAGHAVREANHGQHALDLLADEWRPQLILLDIIMPVMDGLTFLQKKRQIREIMEIPVVVISATAEPPIDGACGVLRKPVDAGELASAVRTYSRS